MGTDVLEYMDPRQLNLYWKNRRWMTWASLGGLFLILALDATGIELALGEPIAWIFASIIFVYFLGNGVVEVIDKIKNGK